MGVVIPQIVTEDRAGGGQVIEGSLKFDSSKSHYLTRTPSSAGNRKTWTWSGWVKRSALSTYQYIWGNANVSAENGFMLRFDNNDVIRIADWTNTAVWQKITTQVFRDVSAWYHIVISYDTTNATASDRVRFYINGSRVTSFSTNTDPTQNYDGYTNNTSADSIGRWGLQADYYLNANISNVYLIDGQALDASYFGYTDPLTNTWRPKKFKPQATPNNGTVWSNDLTSNVGFYAGEGAIYAFDGDNTTYASVATGGASNYINFSCNIPIISTLRVKVSTSTNYVYINGSGTPAVSGTGYLTVPSPPANLTQLRVYGDTGVGARIYAIEVDGIELLDGDTSNMGKNAFYLPFDGNSPIGQDRSGRGNNWTPVNFGGSNTIEKATGALPILNTDGGGKVARVGVRTDSNASSLVLALPLVGIKSDFSNAINSGTSNKVVTVVGGATASSTQSNFYGRSFSFDGSGDALTITNSDMSMGTSNFTCEGWFYYNALPSSSAYRLLGTVNTSGDSTEWGLIHQTAGTLTLWNGSSYVSTGTAPISTGRWTHLAVVRASNVQTLYVNGIAQSTTVTHTGNLTHNIFDIGGRNDGAESFNGYIQDVRIYKGLAKYTQNFIPTSTDPDILPDTPSGVAYSSNVALVPSTDGAVAFDGTDDYLSVGANADFNILGNGTFTIEFFLFANALNGSFADYVGVFDGATTGWLIYQTGSNLDLYTNGSQKLTTPHPPIQKWSHIAITKDGTTTRLFVDGVLQSSTTSSLGSDYSGALQCGGASGRNDLNGFISNLHIVKGTALYTSNFTPPTAPITSVANTKLLCCTSQRLAGAAISSPNISGINNGTVWSANVSTSTGTIVDAPLAFNGSTSSGDAYASSTASDTYIYIDFSSPLSGQFKLWTGMSSGSRTATVTHSGGTSVVNLSSGENTLGTFTSVTRIAVNRGEASTHSFRAISVDGVVLTDPVTVNGNAVATNFNPFTANINTQRGQESGYCTLNPLGAAGATPTNGNLSVSSSSTVGNRISTFFLTSGKWYWEGSGSGYVGTIIGVGGESYTGSVSGTGSKSIGWWELGPVYWDGGNNSGSTSFTTTDVIGIALNMDAGNVRFYKNGLLVYTITFGDGTVPNLSSGVFPGYNVGASTKSVDLNFGQKPFKFPPPAGFQPLALANTPRPTIVRPDQYVGIATWTGNGGTQSINTGFKPDFVWIKDRTNGYNHVLFDSVRGTGGSKVLFSNRTTAEGGGTGEEGTVYGHVSSFDTYGFSVSPGSGAPLWVSNSGDNYVSWAWKAGGNSNTFNINDIGYSTASAAGLASGTITPTGASVNTKSGFSIITWNSPNPAGGITSIPHGLGKTPQFMIFKDRDLNNHWTIYHSSFSNLVRNYLKFSSESIFTRGADLWGTINSNVFSIDEGFLANPGEKCVAYLWAEIPGFSKFGSYTGNGSADGPVVITGFRPKWIMVKGSTFASNWNILDAARDPYNLQSNKLRPNLSNTESSESTGTYAICWDALSNGFKLRGGSSTNDVNQTNETFIYAAFAEAPSFNLYGGQSNAR